MLFRSLSPTTSWTPQSVYLGSVTVPTLAATQLLTVQHVATMPWSLAPQVMYGFVVVDRADVVNRTIVTTGGDESNFVDDGLRLLVHDLTEDGVLAHQPRGRGHGDEEL